MASDSIPKQMRALKSRGAKNAVIVEDAEVPTVDDNFVLIKVECVALNPTDHKHIDYLPQEDNTVGCDFSGTIAAVGKNVKRSVKVGDRVAAVTHGVKSNDKHSGAFGDYAKTTEYGFFHIPSNMDFKDAATLGVGALTTGFCLFYKPGKPLLEVKQDGSVVGNGDNQPVLVYGASSATGMMVVQFAKLAGYKVIGTCSPKNFDLIKSLGAEAVFDYKDTQCASKIREYTNDKLLFAVDCISEGESPQICADSLTTGSGSLYSMILAVNDFPRADVKTVMTLAYTAFGDKFEFRGMTFERVPEDYEFCATFWPLVERLLAHDKIKTPPVRLNDGGKGLEGVLHGLDEFRRGAVSGEKLVYTM